MSKKKGILYCVCNIASKINCESCPKRKKIKPNNCLNYQPWKRFK